MRRGENIYKRKDGRWEARYRKGRDQSGKIIYGSCYGRTYSEAKRKVEQAKKVYPQISLRNTKGAPHFSDVCTEWLHINRFRLKQSTYIKYQTSIEKHIRPTLGDFLLSQITTEEVGHFCSHLLVECGLASKTVQDILVLLHSILEYGGRRYPEAYTNLEIVYPKRQPTQMRALSIVEQESLTNYLLNDLSPCKFGILLALCTGIRIGELCALQWKHINLQDMTISVEATMQRLQANDPHTTGKTKIIIDSPKTVSSVRTIPLSEFALRLCQKMASGNKDVYILTGTTHYMEPRLLQYHFQRYVTDCNLENVTFHTLRHTFATRCVEVDFEIKSLSEILGHANTAITLNRYVHCSMELKRSNMRKVEILNIDLPSK